MLPAERQEIIGAIQTEFRTFKDDAFKPLADSVKANTDKTAEQGEDIAENRAGIKSNKHGIGKVADGIKENRGSIWRLLLLVVGGLLTILGAFFTVWLTG